MMTTLSAVLLALLLVVPAPQTSQKTAGPSIDVFKTATCGCCGKWVDHMRAAGFTVHVQDMSDADLQKIKQKYGVPAATKSCHTARVGGYTIEGHVPASEIKRLLKERPAVVGLAVPGMPLGSPGMEVSGMKAQPYDVLSFDKQGKTQVFATIKP